MRSRARRASMRGCVDACGASHRRQWFQARLAIRRRSRRSQAPRQNETGLHYNWHRSYDPTLVRYTQPDPLGFVDGPSLYAYVNSAPLLLIDFQGLMPDDPQGPNNRPWKYDPNNPPKPPQGEPGVQEPNYKKPPRPHNRETGCAAKLATCLGWCKGNCRSAAIKSTCNAYCIGRYIFCRAAGGGEDVEP